MTIDMRFVDCLFDPTDLVEIRMLPCGRSEFINASEIQSINRVMADANAADQHIYFGANPRKNKGGRAVDIALARCLFVDIDNVNVTDARGRLVKSGMPKPTCLFNSGHGVHAYWRLDEPMSDLAAWTKAQKRLIALLDSDPVIHDRPRIMRMPGFMNHKPPAAMCEIVQADSRKRYKLDDLLRICDKTQQISDYWFQKAIAKAKPGSRNATGLWFACQLRDAGIGETEAEETLRRYAAMQDGDYVVGEAIASVQSAYGRPPRESALVANNIGKQDPTIVPIACDTLPEISPDPLPQWARDYALMLSDAKEVSPTVATLLELAVIASCVQRAFVVEIEGGYVEPLCLYVSPSLESGERKTAIHKPVMKPLFDFQKRQCALAAPEINTLTIKKRIFEKQMAKLEKECLACENESEQNKLQEKMVELAKQCPTVPALPQLIADDFTEASLSVELSKQRESLLVTSDEGGLFDNLCGRHSDISEIDLFLKSHSGSTHIVNRIGRQNLMLHRPLLSVGISPQPAVLSKLGSKEGFQERGLTARFLWALPKSTVGSRKLNPANLPTWSGLHYHNEIWALAEYGYQHEGDPTKIKLSNEAYGIWKVFERELEPRIGPRGDLKPIKPWASKLPGAIARIAAVCHVGNYGKQASEFSISVGQMTTAIEMGRQLIPHSVAAHRLIGGNGMSTAQAVVDYYNRNGWPHGVQTLTEWWRPIRQIVGETSSRFKPVASSLVDHGYLVPVTLHQTGRRGEHYRANHVLHETSGQKESGAA